MEVPIRARDDDDDDSIWGQRERETLRFPLTHYYSIRSPVSSNKGHVFSLFFIALFSGL